MFNLSEYREKPDRLSDLLPWASLVAPGIILNKDGSFLTTVEFSGLDINPADQARQISLHAHLNASLRGLGDGWAVYVEIRRQPALLPPAVPRTGPAAALLATERHLQFSREGALFETSAFITLQYLPEADTTRRPDRYLFGRSDQPGRYGHHLDEFSTATRRLFQQWAGIFPRLTPLDDTALLSYLQSCVCHDLTATLAAAPHYTYLDALLGEAPLIGGFQPRLGVRHLKILSVLGLPPSTVPDIFGALCHIPATFRWVTRWLPLDQHQAEQALKTHRRHWFSRRKGLVALLQESLTGREDSLQDAGALDKAGDADEALRILADGLVSFGYYTASFCLADADPARAQTHLQRAERIFRSAGAAVAEEKINAVDAWLSSLPGHAYANARALLIHSLNLSHLLPVRGLWAGAAPPPDGLFTGITDGNTPFHVPHSVGDVGHKLVIGPTGSGKSVLLSYMASQFYQRPGARVVVFELGESALVTTLAMGGTHYRPGEETGACLQPLQQIGDEDERRWALDWLMQILQQDGIICDAGQQQSLWAALSDLAEFAPAQRTLGGLQALVQDQRLRQGLAPWCGDGPYAAVLDQAEDHLTLADWVCFELATLLDRPRLAQAVLGVLLHRLETRFDGTPTLLILDEAWRLLDDPAFAPRLRAWMKTARKANVGVVFATQSLADVLDHPIWTAIVEGCPSQFLLANPHATSPEGGEVYRRLGLEETELGQISLAMPKRQYYYRSPVGSRLFELGLGEAALALCARSTPADRRHAAALAAACPPEEFLPRWLEHCGLGDLTPYLQPLEEAPHAAS